MRPGTANSSSLSGCTDAALDPGPADGPGRDRVSRGGSLDHRDLRRGARRRELRGGAAGRARLCARCDAADQFRPSGLDHFGAQIGPAPARPGLVGKSTLPLRQCSLSGHRLRQDAGRDVAVESAPILFLRRSRSGRGGGTVGPRRPLAERRRRPGRTARSEGDRSAHRPRQPHRQRRRSAVGGLDAVRGAVVRRPWSPANGAVFR